MAKDFAKRLYKSAAWRRSRDGYIRERIAIDGGLCECCGERLGYIVHHKKALTPLNINDPEVTLNWANYSYECKPCHDLHEGHGVGNYALPLVSFDAEGNVVGQISPPCLDPRQGSGRTECGPLKNTRVTRMTPLP